MTGATDHTPSPMNPPSDKRWVVLHVRPKCEKKMADYCGRNEVCHYLPLRRETKVYQRRKVTVHKPVFPGYVFSDLQLQERPLVLRSNNIVRIIQVDDQQRLLHELEQVRKALDVDDTLGATAAFTRGKYVRIVDGPFRGLEGVIASVRSGTRVMLNVHTIGQGIAIDAETHLLEPIDD